MLPDFEKYRSYVDHFDLSENGKQELVNQVWAMMENAIDRAFQDEPSQRAMADGREIAAKRALDSGAVVDLSKDEYQAHELTTVFTMEITGKKGGK